MAMAIIGMAIGIFLQAYKIYKQEEKSVRDRTQQEKVTRSLAAYLQLNGKYPCPARADEDFASPNFGKAGSCAGAATVGAIPVIDLGLPFDMMADAYGNKMTYAVTTARTNKLTYPNATDAITIKRNGGATKTVPFVLVSHGPDMKGAYALNGKVIGVPCGTTSKDSENCNNDTVFADDDFSQTLNYNSPDRFDDSLTYSLAQKETTLWLISPSDNGVNIANRNTGNVGVGTNAPDAKLHVHDGDLNVDSAGNTGDAGNIISNGKIQAELGSTVSGKSVKAEDSIQAKGNAKAGRMMKARRYCVDVDVDSCE